MTTEELTAIGLTQEQADKVFTMRGKELKASQKQLDELTTEKNNLITERDNLKERLGTAETTLKKFEGIDPEKIQGEIETYKQAAKDAEANFNKQIMQRDQKDWITQKLDEYGVKSPYARKQLTADCMSEDSGLKWKDGSFFGFDDFMQAAKKQDDSLYMTAEEKKALEDAEKLKGKAPGFTGPADNTPPSGDGKKFIPPKIF